MTFDLEGAERLRRQRRAHVFFWFTSWRGTLYRCRYRCSSWLSCPWCGPLAHALRAIHDR